MARRYPERVCANVTPAQRRAVIDYAQLTGSSYAAGVRAGLDLIASRRGAESPATGEDTTEEYALQQAYLRLTGGRLKQGVRLAVLRAEAGLPKQAADAALHRLRKANLIVLYPMDDRAALTAADRRAAVNVSGVAKHVVFWR